MPPLAMVETMVTSCSGVTAISWPMAMEPMEELPHLAGGRNSPRVSPGSSTFDRVPKPKLRMY